MMKRRVGPKRDGSGRWIPWAFVGFFGLVLVVNLAMIWVAFATWPGLTTRSAYQKGLDYNDALAARAAEAELGWRADLRLRPDAARGQVLEVDLQDRHGSFIRDAQVRARLVRPTHEGHDLEVDLPYHTAGTYRASLEVPLAGQWDVRVSARRGDAVVRLRERVHLQP